MKRSLFLTIAVLVLLAFGPVDSLQRTALARSWGRTPCWHGGYYNAAWGMPVALVVPPTAEFQTHWGWGVGNTRITTNRWQFGRNYPGPGYYSRGAFSPTPPWPSDTDQFGIYYVRGPW